MRRHPIGHLALHGIQDDDQVTARTIHAHKPDSEPGAGLQRDDARLLSGAEHGLRIFHINFTPIETTSLSSPDLSRHASKQAGPIEKVPGRTH
jgi:hypothetical protein